MRAELAAALPAVEALPGTAERMGLPDASRGRRDHRAGVALGRPARGLRRDRPRPAARRPGGADLERARRGRPTGSPAGRRSCTAGDSLETSYRDPELGDAFTEPEHATFHWTQRLRAADLRTLAASRSHLILLPPDERDALLDEVDELVATHPDLRGREWIDVPYRTECYRARLR